MMAFKFNHKKGSFSSLYPLNHNNLIMLVLVLIKSHKTFKNLHLIYRIDQ